MLPADEIQDGDRLIVKIPRASYLLGGISTRQIYHLASHSELELVKIGPKLSFITMDSVRRLATCRSEPSSHAPHVQNLKQFKEPRIKRRRPRPLGAPSRRSPGRRPPTRS